MGKMKDFLKKLIGGEKVEEFSLNFPPKGTVQELKRNEKVDLPPDTPVNPRPYDEIEQ